MAATRFRIGAALHSRPGAMRRVSSAPVTRIRTTARVEPSFRDFPDHMLALEAVLPTMSCIQLAKTGASIREMYQAALLSTGAAAGHGSSNFSTPADIATVLDFFQSQLPNQTWLLTYRTAVERHMQPYQEQLGGGLLTSTWGTAQVTAETGHVPGSSSGSSSSSSKRASITADISDSSSAGITCTPEHLADILATIAALPIQVVQPLPIGFGTPRWSRPMAAADPAAWEHWLATLASVYTRLLARQQHAAADAPRELLQQLADFTICLVCSMRWVNVNVDDDRLHTPEYRNKVLHCLKQQHWQQQHAMQRQHEQTITAPHKQSAQHEQHFQQQFGQTPCQQDLSACPSIPFALAGSLLHRITYTCLLLLLPPPRPMLAAFFEATDPSDFSIEQLQSIMRGLLFVGSAPPEPWLQGMVLLVRSKVGELGQKDMLSFVEAFRFFGTQVGRAPWLRDVTALMEEFSCVA